MASSKKRKEEKAKLKNAETRKKAKPSPKKPKKSNKKTAIQNGTVSESKDEVVVTPASSSINDSQQDSETEQEGRSQEQEATNEKKKKPNENGKKLERDDDDEVSKVCNFPMGRIKRIFKTQSSDIGITGEAVFLVNKATDKFLEQFCEDAYECCAKDRKKSLAYKHLAAVVSEQSKYDFLSDYVPEKIKAEDALAQRELAEGGEG